MINIQEYAKELAAKDIIIKQQIKELFEKESKIPYNSIAFRLNIHSGIALYNCLELADEGFLTKEYGGYFELVDRIGIEPTLDTL